MKLLSKSPTTKARGSFVDHYRVRPRLCGLLSLSMFASLGLLNAQQSADLPTPLQSGSLTSFTLPVVTAPTLFSGTYSFSIKVPAGTTQLEVDLNSMYDMSLYVRYGQPVAYGDNGGPIVADYRSETVGGMQSIVITGSPMQAGTYYIALDVSTFGVATSGYLIATATVGCQYNLETSEISMTAAGGLGSISVLSTPACAWTAVGSAPWINVYSHPNGISSGLVGYQVAANTGAARIGVITIGGQVFTIRQAGVGEVLVPNNALLISQFVAGGGQWSMDIFVTNLSVMSEGFTMTFYNADGTLRTMPIQGSGTVSSITGTLASGQTQLIQTGDADTLQQGWAVLIPNSPTASRLSGFAVFRQSLSSGSSEAVVPFMDPTQTRFVLLYDNANGFVTGAALANPSSTLTLTITATARDQTGQTVGSPVTIVLPPLGRTTFKVPDSFAGTGGQRGSIYLSGSAGITGLGLRFSPLATFTSFPLLTSPDIQ
jgi:Bacterial pre-peptidase C-terminal domain